jgi:hypothetical protein
MRYIRRLAVALPAVSALGVVSPAFSAAATTGFLATPTDQIAVPGMVAGGEITPEGDLYTGWAEYELNYGATLTAWNQPTRIVANPALPLLSSSLFDGAVRYTLTTFAVAVAGQPVAYYTITADNESETPKTAQVEMKVAYTRGHQITGPNGVLTGAGRYERPVTPSSDGFFDQPGQAFSPTFSYGISGRDLIRSGLLLARTPAGGRILPSPEAPASLTAAHAAEVYRTALPAHGSVTYTWQIPLNPPAVSAAAVASLARTPLAVARVDLQRTWAAQEAGMMRISVPESKVSDTYDAAVTEILSSRYLTATGWVQGVNKLQYQALWIRDGALMTQALDLAGLATPAAQDLAFIDTFQQPDGLCINRAGQYDSFGEQLWALTQHALLTQSPAYAAAQLPRLAAAIGWLQSVTAADPMGLLPASNITDNERADGHITGHNIWAAAGLRSAVAAAVLAGRPDLAAAWQTVDTHFEASLDVAIESATAANGHIPPVLDTTAGQDWGNYNIAYPLAVLAPSSPAVQSTIAWERTHSTQGLPTYDDGKSLHEYLGFPIFQIELAAGETSAAVAGLYAELTHTTSTDQGWEESVTPWGPRSSAVNLSPHGTFSAGYIALLRNMLVADTSTGASLLSGASPAWLAPGQHISVAGAPTDHGTISYTEHSTASGESLTWHDSFSTDSTLTWTLPSWAKDIRTASGQLNGHTLNLFGSAGTAVVAFSGTRPQQSYAAAAAALDAAYRAHGQPAPLVPAQQGRARRG